MKTIGIAVVGAGNIAQNIHLPQLSAMPGVSIKAICDKQISKTRVLAERYDVPHAFKTVEEALALPDVDAVVVTTSTDAHAPVALAAIESGRHVFVERPVGRTMQEAIDIRDAAHRNDVHVMVGMNHRFRADVVQLKNAIERGDLGPVFYVKAGWVKQRSTDARWLAQADKSGGGVLIDLGIVVIDMILHVFNFGRVRSVMCSTYNHETKSVEDVVVAMITFENGAVATVETSWSLMRAEDLYYCNVFGKAGSAFINPYKLVKRVGNEFQTTVPTSAAPSVSVFRKSYDSELKHFANAVRGLVPMVSTIDEAVERMRVVEAMYASAQQQREIVVP